MAELLKAGWRLGRLMQGARACRRAVDDTARQRARTHLATLLADYRGLPAKIGQLLSTGDGDDPFRNCTQGLPPLPWSTMRQVLSAAWPDWSARVSGIDPQGRAASIAQVHACTATDGRRAALKIRYPAIERAGRSELRVLGLLPNMGPTRTWGVDLDAYRQHLLHAFLAECDFQQEAERQQRYRAALHPDEGVLVAEVLHAADGVLLQDWLDGDDLHGVVTTWTDSERRMLAQRLVTHWCRQCFLRGQVHADPHDGNYRFRRTEQGPSIVLYDFGCLAPIDRATAAGFHRLIQVCRHHHDDDLLAILVAMGFDGGKLRHIVAQLPALCRMITAPFRCETAFDVQVWQPGSDLQALLGEQRWWFRSAGTPGLLFILRSFAGLVRQVRRLGVAIDWCGILNTVTAGSDLHAWRAPPTDLSPVSLTAVAATLRVEMWRGGRRRVDLRLPPTAVDDLPSLMEPALLTRLTARGIDVLAVVREAQRSGYTPQELFRAVDEDQRIAVRLE